MVDLVDWAIRSGQGLPDSEDNILKKHKVHCFYVQLFMLQIIQNYVSLLFSIPCANNVKQTLYLPTGTNSPYEVC